MRARAILVISASHVALSGLALAKDAAPQPDSADYFDFSLHSETQLELFRRALLPGPNGTLVESDTVLPAHQYLRLDVRDLDTGWRRDSVDVELGAWGRAWIGEADAERRMDGDVQTANVVYRHQPLTLRLGRQHVAGGAARYARFDGLAARVELGSGLDVSGYGGFSVLPRWDARPGYHHLGTASDSLLTDPDALPEPERSARPLGGGRIGYTATRARAGLSFHEQHEETGLSRRTLGADARAHVLDDLSAGGTLVFELDAERIQDARLWADARPLEPLDVSLEYLHTEPALFLSRQSVLSVFSTDAYEEGAAFARLAVDERLSLEGEGAVQFHDDGERGARGEAAVRILPGASKRTLVRIGYARVLSPDNGYHSLRASLRRRIVPALTGTIEAYSYLYDRAISGHLSSEVYAGTLTYQATDALDLLWGASLAQSPYAVLDAQTLVQARYRLDFSTHREAP